MNPNGNTKNTGYGDIYGHFGHSADGKSYGGNSDLDEILEKFADSYPCENAPK